MIALDASVLIAHLDAADALHARATTLLDEHAGERYVLSVVTRAEILVRPARAGLLQRVQHALDRLSIETIGIDGDSAESLARLRADTGLRLPDCCVLDMAERRHAGIATFDERMAAVAASRGHRVVR